MKKIVWRIKFAYAVGWIFRDFSGSQYGLGWRVSKKAWDKYKYLKPKEAAMQEITEWYT